MKNDLTYSKAFAELEKLVDEIENDNVPLDKLSDKVKKANEYIKFCETKLRTIEADIKAVTQTPTKKKKRPLTAPTSNWRGRGNRKFCIFKNPFVVIDS